MNEAIIALVALLMMFAVPAIGWWFKRRQRGKAIRPPIGLSYVKTSSRLLRIYHLGGTISIFGWLMKRRQRKDSWLLILSDYL